MNPTLAQVNPQANQDPNQPQEMAQPSPQNGSNQAMTNLGFANNMLSHLIEHKGKKNKPKQVEQKPAEKPTEPVEKKEPEKAAPEENKETEQVVTKVEEMESKHSKELEDLKKSIDNDNLEAKIKKDYEKKIADMEKAHAKEMKSVKDEIKSILNG